MEHNRRLLYQQHLLELIIPLMDGILLQVVEQREVMLELLILQQLVRPCMHSGRRMLLNDLQMFVYDRLTIVLVKQHKMIVCIIIVKMNMIILKIVHGSLHNQPIILKHEQQDHVMSGFLISVIQCGQCRILIEKLVHKLILMEPGLHVN
jgi:hypothetical protein